MLMLLSPAKSLDYETPVPAGLPDTTPVFLDQSALLIEQLRQLSVQQVAELMALSDKLAALNVARYAAWEAHAPAEATRPAVMAFNGDVYEGLDARSLSVADWQWAQSHLAILSGLYGVLRPLDRLQPYRLEMGTRLANARGPHLYAFWGTRIAEHLQAQLEATAQPPLILNLASQEYFKAVDRKALKARVVECVFEDYKGGQYKIISFHAKRARGLMARHAIVQRAQGVEALLDFQAEGYAYAPEVSTSDRLVFRRRIVS